MAKNWDYANLTHTAKRNRICSKSSMIRIEEEYAYNF